MESSTSPGIFREDVKRQDSPFEISYVHGACAGALIGRTIGSILEEAARCHPESQAFHFPTFKETITFSQLLKKTDQVARGLMALGVEKGDRLVVLGFNGFDWLATFLGIASIGAIYNGPYLYKPKEKMLKRTLDKLDCKAVILLGDPSCDMEILRSLIPEMTTNGKQQIQSVMYPTLKYIISGNENLSGTISLKECIARGEMISDESYMNRKSSVTMEDGVIIISSTGTTGDPKCPLWSHFAMISCGAIQVARNCPNDKPVILGTQSPNEDDIYPVFNVVTTIATHSMGSKLVMLPDIDLEDLSQTVRNYLRVLQDYKINHCFLYPHVWMSIMMSDDYENYDLNSLTNGIAAGWKVHHDVAATLLDIVPGFCVSLSCSEYWPITNNFPGGDRQRKSNTVGFVVPHTQVKLVDEQNCIVPIGEIGEINVRGPAMFTLYWGEPELTAKVKDAHGWYHTGDMGRMDSEGFLEFVGRKRDAIRFKSWGDIVYPGYIEDAVRQMDPIQEVKVIGLQNDFKGFDICLCVVMKQGHTFSEERICDFLKNQLTSKDIPDFILHFDHFPKLGARKKVNVRSVQTMAKEMIEKHGLSKSPESYAENLK